MTIGSVVIVGAGHAGFQTAASLRQDGFQGRITLIGDEPGLPYQRPPLSKAYLLDKLEQQALFFRPEKFFDEHRIESVHDRALAIDRTNARVTLASGTALPYEHLVLATGARNRALAVSGVELEGVSGLRTLGDAAALAPRLKAAHDVVVVGAGFIGLEFAAVARATGASVRVLELADRPMARAVTQQTAAFFREVHEGWGVALDFRQPPARFTGDGRRVTGVETSDGRHLRADLVVFGIGVQPNVQLAADAGLDIENGIRVDANLLTSDPAISAVGDSVFFPSQHAGRHIRLESVQNAVDQARSVAGRLTGKPAPYAALPWFWTDQGDLKLQIAGLPGTDDATVMTGDKASRQFSVLCFRQGQLVAVESVNRPGDHMAARRVLARPPTLTPSAAAEPGFDLKAWEASSR